MCQWNPLLQSPDTLSHWLVLAQLSLHLVHCPPSKYQPVWQVAHTVGWFTTQMLQFPTVQLNVSPNCIQGECDDSGICTQGCNGKRYGQKCDSLCSNCLTTCNRNSGVCDSTCVNGYYGSDCSMCHYMPLWQSHTHYRHNSNHIALDMRFRNIQIYNQSNISHRLGYIDWYIQLRCWKLSHLCGKSTKGVCYLSNRLVFGWWTMH
jgi:hypothetical protein